MAQYYKGKFTPKSSSKYRGDPTNIIYRSLWELRVMKYLDEHPHVLEWSSEEIIVPYESPIDGQWHRYFPDFYAKFKERDGSIVHRLIEVKPEAQTKEPVIQAKKRKPSKRYIMEVQTWGVNSAKWNAARAYCQKKGWVFDIITEKDLRLR